MSTKEVGPIYGVELIESLPIGTTGLEQAMPSRADLDAASKVSERTVAGYEMLLKEWRREREQREKLSNWINSNEHLFTYWPDLKLPDAAMTETEVVG